MNDDAHFDAITLRQAANVLQRRAGQLLQEAARIDPHPPSKVRHRILWNERGEDIDEIVISDASTVHVEQMDVRCWWIGIDISGGGYWSGNFHADSRGRMRFTEQEMEGFAWDQDDDHRDLRADPS